MRDLLTAQARGRSLAAAPCKNIWEEMFLVSECFRSFASGFFAGMAEPAVGAPAAATGASAFALLPVVNAPGCHSYKNSRHQYADKDGWEIHLESLLSFYGFMEMDGKRSVKRLVYANL